jgi:hypothetical protein
MDSTIILIICCSSCCLILSSFSGFYYKKTTDLKNQSNNKQVSSTTDKQDNETIEKQESSKIENEQDVLETNIITEIVSTTPIITTTQSPFLYPFTSHQFTNANSIGKNGPKLDAIRTFYSYTDWTQDTTNNYLNMINDNGIQLWTVPITGKYTIRVVGANGGNSLDGTSGGKGIDISTIASLNKGEIISILVGQTGLSVDVSPNESAGGGGGSFVIKDTKIPIIIAGGGGGGSSKKSYNDYVGDKNGGDAIRIMNGGGGGFSLNETLSSKAGINGNGAISSVGLTGNGNGGNGGGFKSGGQEGQEEQRFAGFGYITGLGVGGGENGGFGCGASGFGNPKNGGGGGGGGGYSGGAGALFNANSIPPIFYKSGGGGSYALSTMTVNGKNSSEDGNGSVTITLNK